MEELQLQPPVVQTQDGPFVAAAKMPVVGLLLEGFVHRVPDVVATLEIGHIIYDLTRQVFTAKSANIEYRLVAVPVSVRRHNPGSAGP